MSFGEGNVREQLKQLQAQNERLYDLASKQSMFIDELLTKLEQAYCYIDKGKPRPKPERQTCDTCDWWCYGTYPDNTCDKWEYTIAEVPVDEDVIAAITNQPTSKDFADLEREIDKLEGVNNGD